MLLEGLLFEGLIFCHILRGGLEVTLFQVCVWGLEDLPILFSSGKAIANKFRTVNNPEVQIPILLWLW